MWNNLNVLLGEQFYLKSELMTKNVIFLVCPSSFALVTPTLLYPYCYRINQQNHLKTQQQAIQECEQQKTQLVWFQSIDELEEHLIPALVSHGLTRG